MRAEDLDAALWCSGAWAMRNARRKAIAKHHNGVVSTEQTLRADAVSHLMQHGLSSEAAERALGLFLNPRSET